MNFITQNWMLILVALVSGGLLLAPMLRGTGAGLTAAAAVQRINREKGVLIDIRDAAEFATSHAKGAKHVPLAEIDSKLPQAAKNKAFPIIVMCATGNRAAGAVSKIKKLGYGDVQILSGGLKAWRAADLPVEKSA